MMKFQPSIFIYFKKHCVLYLFVSQALMLEFYLIDIMLDWKKAEGHVAGNLVNVLYFK